VRRRCGAAEPLNRGPLLPRSHLGPSMVALHAVARPAARCRAAGGRRGERAGSRARAEPATGVPRVRAGRPRSARHRRPAGIPRRASAGAGTARCWSRRGRAVGGGWAGRMGRAGGMGRAGRMGRIPPAVPAHPGRRRRTGRCSGRTAGPVSRAAPVFRTTRCPAGAAEPSVARRATILRRPRRGRTGRGRTGRYPRPVRIRAAATTPTCPPEPASSQAPSDPDHPRPAEATSRHRPLRGRCRGPKGAQTHPAPTHPADDHCFPAAARRPGHSG